MRACLAAVVCGLVGLVGLAGCGEASSSGTKTVAALPPSANAGGPYSAVAGTAVSFSAAGSSDPQGQALTYAWNFGDSTTGTGAAPSHTYAASGTYTVTVTVTDTSGLSGTATTKATADLADTALTGTVYSGTQPVNGAHVYLLAANTTGYGGSGIAASNTNASVSLLNAALTGASDSVGAYVTANASGAFSMSGDYTCASGQQVYLYATGATGAAWMAALGPCPGTSGPAIAANVNEVSTTTTAYAMAGFATDATHVSSSGTALAATGIANAFANAANLETLSTGAALATTPAGNGTVPQSEIYTLANILASCSRGGAQCSVLFANATADGTSSGAKPTETATAAINIAHNSGANVASLYALASGGAFTPGLTSAPNDWTVQLSFSGGGISGPIGVAIDGRGNAWLADSVNSSVSELSSTGAVLSGTNGFSGGGLVHSKFIAVDPSDDAWVTSFSMNNVVEISPGGSFLSGTSGYPATNPLGQTAINSPTGIAIDGAGNVWIPGGQSGSYYQGIALLSNTGSLLNWVAGLGIPGFNGPAGIAFDSSGTAYVAMNGGEVLWFSNVGGWTISDAVGLGTFSLPSQVAVDAGGNVWVTSPGANNVAKISNGYVPTISGGGLSGPYIIAVDGGGNLWVSSSGTQSVVEFSNSGTAESGASGYRGADQVTILGVAVDGSGNVWTTHGGSSINEIIGAATPVVTPLSVGVRDNKLGTRP
jgi:PKD repeat protein